MSADTAAVRTELVRIARRLAESDLGVGTSGNLSARTARGFAITPTAYPYDQLRQDDIVELSLAGDTIAGHRRPSSEWRFHAAIYAARAEACAVVHAHPPHATALSCLRREIPPFHYLVGACGGRSIRCAGWATPGSRELAAGAVEALEERRACLLANHGLIAFGGSLEEAFGLAVEVEALARLYLLAVQVGDPVLLSDAEMGRVLERFSDYRPKPEG